LAVNIVLLRLLVRRAQYVGSQRHWPARSEYTKSHYNKRDLLKCFFAKVKKTDGRSYCSRNNRFFRNTRTATTNTGININKSSKEPVPPSGEIESALSTKSIGFLTSHC
jgi:hypothetical protein